jgi:hypothetical protein
LRQFSDYPPLLVTTAVQTLAVILVAALLTTLIEMATYHMTKAIHLLLVTEATITIWLKTASICTPYNCACSYTESMYNPCSSVPVAHT